MELCKLAGTDAIPDELEEALRNSAGGHYNHSFYFTSVAPASMKTKPGPDLMKAIDMVFGSLDDLKAVITQVSLCGLLLR